MVALWELVNEHVAAQITVATEFLAALGAVEWLDVRVREQMCLEVGSLVEATATEVTLVRRVLLVQNSVHCQGSRLAKAFATLGAFEWLLL